MISLFVGGDVALLLHKTFCRQEFPTIATANFRIQAIRLISYEHPLSMQVYLEKAFPTASGPPAKKISVCGLGNR